MSKAHPNLKEDVFDTIDTKEKAYWLGFLFADGAIVTTRLSLCSSMKDEHWIDEFIKFIGANKKFYYTHKHTGKTYVSVAIWSKTITSVLARYGCVERKSKIIRLPNLGSREFDLAFLMGYFDGDGREDNSQLYSGSIDFLNDIKMRYPEISYEVKEKKQKYICYCLWLGAKIFIEMALNYPNSLPRKRKTYKSQTYSIEEGFSGTSWNKGKSFPEMHKVPHPTKEELERLVWELPTSTVAKNLNVSSSTISKWCRKYSISKPPRGYWQKRQAAKSLDNPTAT